MSYLLHSKISEYPDYLSDNKIKALKKKVSEDFGIGEFSAKTFSVEEYDHKVYNSVMNNTKFEFVGYDEVYPWNSFRKWVIPTKGIKCFLFIKNGVVGLSVKRANTSIGRNNDQLKFEGYAIRSYTKRKMHYFEFSKDKKKFLIKTDNKIAIEQIMELLSKVQ